MTFIKKDSLSFLQIRCQFRHFDAALFISFSSLFFFSCLLFINLFFFFLCIFIYLPSFSLSIILSYLYLILLSLSPLPSFFSSPLSSLLLLSSTLFFFSPHLSSPSQPLLHCSCYYKKQKQKQINIAMTTTSSLPIFSHLLFFILSEQSHYTPITTIITFYFSSLTSYSSSYLYSDNNHTTHLSLQS
jgi:hypothetical protein